MTQPELKQFCDRVFGLESQVDGNDFIYASPTGIELLGIATYFDELKQTWRVSAIKHNDSGFHNRLFDLDRQENRQ